MAFGNFAQENFGKGILFQKLRKQVQSAPGRVGVTTLKNYRFVVMNYKTENSSQNAVTSYDTMHVLFNV